MTVSFLRAQFVHLVCFSGVRGGDPLLLAVLAVLNFRNNASFRRETTIVGGARGAIVPHPEKTFGKELLRALSSLFSFLRSPSFVYVMCSLFCQNNSMLTVGWQGGDGRKDLRGQCLWVALFTVVLVVVPRVRKYLSIAILPILGASPGVAVLILRLPVARVVVLLLVFDGGA